MATRLNWLRAAVLGPNDGIVSTARLVVGVAGATASGQRAGTYQSKGPQPCLARQVAEQLTRRPGRPAARSRSRRGRPRA